jgi:exopolysaccharide biosynthesis protein
MVVDGRQGAYSSGMTLEEVTGTFESLGATEALNLDGGGSSVMVVHGIARSRPSDADGERAVRNALAVVGDPEYCRALSGPTLEGGA